MRQSVADIEDLLQRDLKAATLMAQARYSEAGSVEDRIIAGTLLAECLSRRGRQDSAERMLSRLSLSASGNPRHEAMVLCQLAWIDSRRGRFTQMLRRAVQARARAGEAGDREIEARCLSAVAMAYDVLGVHGESMQHRVNELLIWQRLGRPAPVESLVHLAGLYQQLGRHEEAIVVAERCLTRSLAEHSPRHEARVRCTRAQCLEALGRLDEAEVDLLAGQLIFAQIGDQEESLRQEIRLGELMCKQGKHRLALDTLRRIRDGLPVDVSPRLEAELLAARAQIADACGEDAVERFSRALAWFESLNMGAQMAKMHDALYRIHKREERWRSALTHHEALLAVRGALLSERSEARVDALRVRYEVTRLEQERRISHLRNVELAAAYERLQVLATQDPVTGLFNRRYLDTRLAEELQRVARYACSLSVMLFDIDHFKGVNDSFGHATGDAVLKGVAELLLENTREVDIAARYGGDEFAVVFPDTDLDGARLAAEKLRQLVAAHDWSAVAEGLAVTISGGVAALPADDPLLEVADRQLYISKEAGRNRISG